MSERPIPGVFLDTDQATRLYHVCMGVVEMAETARTANSPNATLAVFKRELLNLLEVVPGFSIGRGHSDFKASAKKHLEDEEPGWTRRLKT